MTTLVSTPDTGPRVPHIAYLDGLRGLLAFYVLGFHYLGANVEGVTPVLGRVLTVFHFGHPAVGFFIVLSGYSLMLPEVTSADPARRGGFLGYLTRRARRIWPPYYAALGLSVAVVAVVLSVEKPDWVSAMPSELSAACIVSHILLIHTLVPGQHGTINMALWSIATEWHLYFFFPLLLLPVWRKAGMATLLLVGFGLGLLPQLLIPVSGSFLRYGCPWYLGLFALGMTAAVIEHRPAHDWLRSRPTLFLVFLTSSALFLVVKALSPGVDEGGRFSLQWLKDTTAAIPAWCLLLHCADVRPPPRRGMDSLSRPLSLRILESRPAILLGGFSYSLYVTHCSLLTGINCVTHRLGLGPTPAVLVRLCLGVPLALGFAFVFAKVFETPFLRKQRSRM